MLERILVLMAAILYWRPWRRERANEALARAARVLLVRIDDRVGEAILLTPMFATLKSREPQPQVHVLVHPNTLHILDGHPAVDRVIPFERKGLWFTPLDEQILALRRSSYDVVVDCSDWMNPCAAHAVVARSVGPHSAVLGPWGWPMRWLRTHPAKPRPDTRREVAQRLHLLSPLRGLRNDETLTHRPAEPARSMGPLLDMARDAAHAVINPGGRHDWRRVPAEAFSLAAREMLEAGYKPIVTWGPGEEGLARFVADSVPGSLLAPRTSLDDLAALMAATGVTVCNNSGPMHLSLAVGAATMQLFVKTDPVRWGQAEAPNRVVDLTQVADNPPELERKMVEQIREFLDGVAQDHLRRGVGA